MTKPIVAMEKTFQALDEPLTMGLRPEDGQVQSDGHDDDEVWVLLLVATLKIAAEMCQQLISFWAPVYM
jgi:hypothetical protein